MHSVTAHDAAIPAIGLGTWTLKGRECSDLVAEGLRLGYRHIDTAAMYGNERAVGEGFRASGVPRASVFITPKVWWTDLKPSDFRRSIEESLVNLALDHVDLLLIHWPNPKIPLSATIQALNDARRDGLTRHIGVSNFTTTLLAEARQLSPAPLVANQVEYHPYLGQAKLLGACREAGMAMVSYAPLSRGGPLFSEPAIARAARAHDRTPGQIVLRWHVQQANIVAIPRTSRPERLAENLAIFDFRLTDSEMAEISALGAKQRRICDYDFSPRWDAA